MDIPENTSLRRSTREQKQTSKAREANEGPPATATTSTPRDSPRTMTPSQDKRKAAALPPDPNKKSKNKKKKKKARRDSVDFSAQGAPIISREGAGPSNPLNAAESAQNSDSYDELACLDNFSVANILPPFEDGADDDWTAVSGNPDSWHNTQPGRSPKTALAEGVANIFVCRARIACRQGLSWTEFENKERAIDSAAVDEKQKDPKIRASLVRDALDNDLRLAILDRIARKICADVFHTAYPTPHADRPRPVTINAPRSDEERTAKDWKESGEQGVAPVFKDDASDASSEVDIDEYSRSIKAEEVLQWLNDA